MTAEPEWIGNLRSRHPGVPLRYHEVVGSTNDIARGWLDDGGPDGLVVVAGSQRAGRGRRERTWCSPPGKGLYLSLGLRAMGPASAGLNLSFLGAVAVAEALWELPAEIRWPNDVDVRGRKIAGILAEGRMEGERLASAVLGIGLNVSHGPDDLPGGVAATSVLREGSSRGPDELAAGIIQAVLRWRSIHRERPEALLDRWRELSPGHRGRRVIVEQDRRTFTGVTCGVESDGALRVQEEDGRVTVVRAGELRRLREG